MPHMSAINFKPLTCSDRRVRIVCSISSKHASDINPRPKL
jgi:hypothetical protein